MSPPVVPEQKPGGQEHEHDLKRNGGGVQIGERKRETENGRDSFSRSFRSFTSPSKKRPDHRAIANLLNGERRRRCMPGAEKRAAKHLRHRNYIEASRTS